MTQATALSILSLGHTTFLTGPAGSGKSYVLRQYIQYLKEHGVTVAITASTGIAATHIGGATIHSWSGLGVRDELNDYDLSLFEEKKALYTRYQNTNVVIIDEISMLSSNFLDMFDRVCKYMKRSHLPFGGMQIIFCGDFFQLPPVVRGQVDALPYAYTSSAWKEAKPVICYLHEQHRQEDDTLTGILGQIRSGNIDEFVWEALQARLDSEIGDELHTKLYTHNVDVDVINQESYSKLDGDEKVYTMETRGRKNLVESLKKNCLASETLRLKLGAKVICIKNDMDRKYVNGSLGEVVGFDREDMPEVLLATGRRITVRPESWKIEEDGKVKAEITQLPLKLAWAITVHKSQGMTLDKALIDLSKTFVAGQGYVALSRVKSIDGLYLEGMNERALLIDPSVRAQDVAFQGASEKAEDAIAKYNDTELTERKEAFLVRAGGQVETLDPAEIEKQEKTSTLHLTQELLKDKLSLKEIAEKRGITIDTVIGHIEKLIDGSEEVVVAHLLPKKKDAEKIVAAFEKHGIKLTPVFEALKGVHSYHDLRIVRAHMRLKDI